MNSKIQKNSLLLFSKRIYSQHGDDGIIERIFEVLNINKGLFIEFGAWDGIYLSNCRYLFEKGWDGVFIEADKKKYVDLVKNYKDVSNILSLNLKVSFKKKDKNSKTLDNIAKEYFANQHVDFLSIDIDGLDYKILETLKMKPTVICIEGGFSWSPHYKKRVPDKIAAKNLQQPIAVTIKIAKNKGYQPICFNQNLFLIKDEYYPKFKDVKNDHVTLWKEAFYYMSDRDKKYLINFRKQTFIKEIESSHFSTKLRMVFKLFFIKFNFIAIILNRLPYLQKISYVMKRKRNSRIFKILNNLFPSLSLF